MAVVVVVVHLLVHNTSSLSRRINSDGHAYMPYAYHFRFSRSDPPQFAAGSTPHRFRERGSGDVAGSRAGKVLTRPRRGRLSRSVSTADSVPCPSPSPCTSHFPFPWSNALSADSRSHVIPGPAATAEELESQPFVRPEGKSLSWGLGFRFRDSTCARVGGLGQYEKKGT